MTWIVRNLWLIPLLPVVAAALCALLRRGSRGLGAALAIGTMALSFLLSLAAFAHVLRLVNHGEGTRETISFRWFQFGDQWLSLGGILDPLTALMFVMVTFISLLVFIYSIGYMEHDENCKQFFCFLSLFAGAMLGVVIANSLLLLFMCWEIVGLTSYLLIGFWYHSPKAAAAAKKAFIVTRIGDLPFFLGLVWLYQQTGTLLFYDGGAGCMEPTALSRLLGHTTAVGMGVSTAIALLIFCGAAGKSGQVPLHVWLPDAMEGPTPVSALIHAATMVAAGVFLVARVYPLMSAHAENAGAGSATSALQVVTWVGAITAVFGSLVAVAQFDIKRILAYSTISQLGYMMMGLGTGGVAVGIFHLITHAFFKSLLFLGAGSVIHGCSGEQDIRRMGGLRGSMPITFVTYTAGMLALCGFPLFFSGFWSKDGILHAAHEWSISQVPFYMGIFAALLTAFYMTRQMYYVFAGSRRLVEQDLPHAHDGHHAAHESPAVMTIPLGILAAFAVLLGVFGTPAWPWLQTFLEDNHASFNIGALLSPGIVAVMLMSSVVVLVGIAAGWWFYGRRPIDRDDAPDVVERIQPTSFKVFGQAFYIDRLYGATIVRLNNAVATTSDWMDRRVLGGAVRAFIYATLRLASLDNFFDTRAINPGFDEGCQGVSRSSELFSRLQGGRVQVYLTLLGVALVAFTLWMLWGAAA